MADDKQSMQADGSGTDPKTDGPDGNGELASRRGGLSQTGESGGGAYPNPHSGKEGKGDGPEGFMGHGGQSDMEYYGDDRLGEKGVGNADPNSATEDAS